MLIPLPYTRLGLGAVVFAIGLVVNVIAAYTVPPLALDNLGPLALAWHERSPVILMIGLALLVVIVRRMHLRPGLQTVVTILLGAGCAQVASIVWFGGNGPDYIVIRRFDIIANVPDLIMLTTVIVAVAVAVGRSASLLKARSR